MTTISIMNLETIKQNYEIDTESTPLLNTAIEKIQRCCNETQEKAMNITDEIQKIAKCEKFINEDYGSEEAKGITSMIQTMLKKVMTKEEKEELLDYEKVA